MKKSLIALSILAVSGSALAANNTFKFRVFSSGADIFPCNAGIIHQGPQMQDGYTVDTNNPDYNGYGSEVVDNVTNTSISGSYLPDYMSYKTVAFDEWSGSQSVLETGKKFAEAEGFRGDWQAIFGGEDYLDLDEASKLSNEIHKEDDVNNIVSSLDFVLSSENYGTKYFVDVCYYAPQFAPSNTGDNNYNLTSKVSFSNLVSGRDYIKRADVNFDVKVHCDGEYKTKRTNQEVIVGSEQTVYNRQIIAGRDSDAPKKCVVRYTFEENSDARRNHAAHGGIFTLYTDITDPASN